jgi:hypothetical protein
MKTNIAIDSIDHKIGNNDLSADAAGPEWAREYY